MKRLPAIIAAVCMTLSAYAHGACRAEDDDLCSWTTIYVSRALNERWSLGGIADGRSVNDTVEQFFLRPLVAYRFGKGFQAKFLSDLAFYPSGLGIRIVPELSYTYKRGDFSCVLRHRYRASWKQRSGDWTSMMRSRAMLYYRITGTILSPATAVEPFYWNGMDHCRYYAGVRLQLSGQTSLLLQYVRQDFSAAAKADQNVFWIMYSVNLP